MDKSRRAAAWLPRLGGVRRARRPCPANPPAAADQQRADKEMELRGVEDTLRSRTSSGGRSRPKWTPFAPIGPAFPQRLSKPPPRCRTPSAAPPRQPRDCRASTQPPTNSRVRSSVGAELSPTCLRPSSGWKQSSPRHSRQARRHVAGGPRGHRHGALIPELKSEIEAARRDLDDLAKTRKSIARERDELTERAKALRPKKCALRRSLTRASSLWPRRRTRSARSSNARPTSPKRRGRSRISSQSSIARAPLVKPRQRRHMRPRLPWRTKSRRERKPLTAPKQRASSPKSPSPTRKDACGCPPRARF